MNTDDNYLKHAAISDKLELEAYQKRVRFKGYCLLAITTGALLAIARIAYQLLH